MPSLLQVSVVLTMLVVDNSIKNWTGGVYNCFALSSICMFFVPCGLTNLLTLQCPDIQTKATV